MTSYLSTFSIHLINSVNKKVLTDFEERSIMISMHPIQQKILEIAKTQDIYKIGIRPLGRLIGIAKPQLVKHHLLQLQKKGLLKPTSGPDIIRSLRQSATLQPSFMKVPVVGEANCGEATCLAEQRGDTSITISESLLKKRQNICALQAKGNSMNKANIDGKTIEDGDYVIVDCDYRYPRANDYVLSVIDNCANIKKFSRTRDGNIALISESTESNPPIYIGESDQFFVNGRVIQVIKK